MTSVKLNIKLIIVFSLLITISISIMPAEGGGGPDATLKITKLTTGADGIFDFTVTGPTSYSPSISTSGGGGFDQKTIVPGTYSIQETIPSNWNLISATCNDGSSSFSVDTVSGIVINPESSIECTFENTFTGTEPNPVTGLVATATGVSAINLVWTAPGDGGSPITGYTIERESPVGGGFTVLIADTGTTATTFEDTNLMADTQYNYRISAINSVGIGTASNEANATTQSAPGTLTISKMTTDGDDTFDFTVTGPTSYVTSITTAGSDGIDTVNPTLAISSFSDSGNDNKIFINADPVSDIGASGAIGNSITLTGEKITNLVTLGIWESTTGTITAYIWSGITQNSTLEGSETIVAQSDTWDFALHGGGEFPQTDPNNFYDLMVFNFSSPVSLTGDYVIGYKWVDIDSFGNSVGSRYSLAGGNSIFRSDGCTITETGASDTWSSCHTELSFPIRNLSMDITIEEDVTNVDAGTGIQTSNLVVHHTFDSSEIEGGIGLNAGTLGGDANAYYLHDSATDDYTGDWYLSDYILNNLAQLNDAHINGFNSTTGTGTIVQLGNFHNRAQWNFLHDNLTNEYTISFWIKGDLDEASPIPVINTISETNGLVFGFDGGIPYLIIGQEDFETNGNIPIENAQFSGLTLPDDNNFHLITLSIEKSNVTSTAKACIDLTCDTVDRNEPFLTSVLADRPFTIGEDHDERTFLALFEGGRSYSEFQMDDLCIWRNIVLSSSERNTLYNSGSGQTCATVVEGVGSGMHGPTLVDTGTYSIQETIPSGWSLTTATCNDGSSSFSVDTVSNIVLNSNDDITCTFENGFSATGTDVDGDGIFNEIDTLPNTFSNDFSDVSIGGTSFGDIGIRGDQILTITEEANPLGVRIKADISGGLLPATVDTCGGLSTIVFSPNDEVVVTCSSVTIKVISGEVEVTFFSSGGTIGTTSISAGNSITFDQNAFRFSTPSTNTQTIIIDVEGTPITINPGGTNTSEPEVGPIIASLDPIQLGGLVEANANFTDLGPLETHTAEWDWGDNTTSVGIVTENGLSGNVTGSHTYSATGVFSVTLTVTDDTGDSGTSIFQFVVIYDPNGGFVTGGGWIDSPIGAYVPDSSLVGKATFGFVSKYQNGANTPTGNTQFSFKVADLKFKSSEYDWLVVAGSNAKFKGTGTIDGDGNYGFQLFGFDADLNSNDNKFDDKFRIKIWDKDNGDVVVYDNNIGESENAEPSTILGGGSIMIHQP